jgi:hypothetical protein
MMLNAVNECFYGDDVEMVMTYYFTGNITSVQFMFQNIITLHFSCFQYFNGLLKSIVVAEIYNKFFTLTRK